jgi:hypothetical protein
VVIDEGCGDHAVGFLDSADGLHQGVVILRIDGNNQFPGAGGAVAFNAWNVGQQAFDGGNPPGPCLNQKAGDMGGVVVRADRDEVSSRLRRDQIFSFKHESLSVAPKRLEHLRRARRSDNQLIYPNGKSQGPNQSHGNGRRKENGQKQERPKLP